MATSSPPGSKKKGKALSTRVLDANRNVGQAMVDYGGGMVNQAGSMIHGLGSALGAIGHVAQWTPVGPKNPGIQSRGGAHVGSGSPVGPIQVGPPRTFNQGPATPYTVDAQGRVIPIAPARPAPAPGRAVAGPPAPRGAVTAKTVFQRPRANEFSTTNPITRSLTASTYGAQQPAPPLTHSQRAARLRSEAQTHLYSGNPEKAAQTIVEALGAGYGFTDNQQNPNINGYGEYRPTSPTTPYGFQGDANTYTGSVQDYAANFAPTADPQTAYRAQIAAQAQTLDAGRTTPWLRAAEPLPGNLPSEPRTASEFVNALTPAQLASPEVQDLLKTLLGEDPQPWGSWYNGYQR